jgi:DNA-binding Xre family transcriptional regulator
MDGTEEGESIVTLTEAMKYRGLTVWKLAERTGVKTQTAKKWTEPGGTRKITVERLRQITEILDGGALITEDGVEFELYGGKV